MRTTISIDPDNRAAIDELARASGRGLSETVNEILRAGLARKPARKPFVQETASLGLQIDVSNVAEALEELDGPAWR
jgi:Ribbon-helix-helix protein, copG family